jgi:hypothetical protein
MMAWRSIKTDIHSCERSAGRFGTGTDIPRPHVPGDIWTTDIAVGAYDYPRHQRSARGTNLNGTHCCNPLLRVGS